MRRVIAGVASAGAFVLLAAGCGGSGGSDDSGSASEERPEQAAEVAEPEPIAVDTAARATVWTDPEDRGHEVEIAPVALGRGDVSDLDGIQLDADLARMVPHYLTFSYTPTGDEPLVEADLARNLSVNGGDGQPAERLTFFGGWGDTPAPGGCDMTTPERVAAGETAEACQIFMLAEGQEAVSVSYTDADAAPLVWLVEGAEADESLLAADEAVETSWQDSDSRNVPLRATPVSVAAGTMDDLRDWDVDDENVVPYYVTVEYRNGSEVEVYPNFQEAVELRTVSGQSVQQLLLLDVYGVGVEPCPERLPDEMVPPGGTVTMCSIHLVDEGDTPSVLVFQPRGAQTEPVTWQVPEQE
ncbi:hypothetical protein ACTWP5_29035 [Streptomyces sp. 4N509B]|uniref:hypothetical protein n=1 Tax=Streptomyces sp. 4N509B TaxID=3457413 RepID=UPI003FCF500F